MATFPYVDRVPKTGGKEVEFISAHLPIDIAYRTQMAAWLLLTARGGDEAAAVVTYTSEVQARDITTEPTTGPMIRAYTVARNLVEYAARGTDWDDALTSWLNELSRVVDGFALLFEYEYKEAQSLVDRINGALTTVTPSATFSANGLTTDATYAVTVPTNLLPTTDFRIELDFIFDAFTLSTGPRALYSRVDADNYIEVYYATGTDKWVFAIEVAGVVTTKAFSVATIPVQGSAVDLAIEIHSTLGMRIEVNGVWSGYNASATACVWGTDLMLMNRSTDNDQNIDGDIVYLRGETIPSTNFITNAGGDILTDPLGNSLVYT